MSVFLEKDIPDGCLFVKGIFDITNGTDRQLQLNRGTDALIAHFSSVVLKNVKRPDRGKNEELVTELKYAFIFYTSVKIFGREIPLRVSGTFSTVPIPNGMEMWKCQKKMKYIVQLVSSKSEVVYAINVKYCAVLWQGFPLNCT